MKHHVKIVVLASLGLLGLGCSEMPSGLSDVKSHGSSASSTTSASSDAKATSAAPPPTQTENHPPAETKPSEGSEGVPGYLVDPSGLVLQNGKDGAQSTLSAPAGSVAADAGAPSGVVVNVWQVAASEIDQFLNGQPPKNPVEGKLLAKGSPTEQGGFNIPFVYDQTGYIVITVAPQDAVDGTQVKLDGPRNGKAQTAVIDAATGGAFKELSQFIVNLAQLAADLFQNNADEPKKHDGPGKHH